MKEIKKLFKLKSKKGEGLGYGGLIDFGRREGEVTIDDVFSYVPEAKTNVDLLKKVYSKLQEVGIGLVDDEMAIEPIESELKEIASEIKDKEDEELLEKREAYFKSADEGDMIN